MSTEATVSLATVGAPASPAGSPQAPAPAQQTAPAPAAPRVTPGSKAWAEMTPEQRHAQLRGPENPRARGHSPARDQREATEEGAASPGSETPATEDPQGSAHSAEKLKVGKYEVSEAELAAMMDRQAQDDLRKATIPATPEAYEAKLPADFKLPAGIEYKFDLTDPSLIAARNLAHAKGWSQQDFSEALGIFASHIAGKEAVLAERSRAEVAKAGVNAPQRVDAVGKWITGMVGEADAKPIRATICTDAHLRFYENIMNKLTSQGAASFTGSHRIPAEDGGIPGYENMSFEQRRFAQDQQAARRGR